MTIKNNLCLLLVALMSLSTTVVKAPRGCCSRRAVEGIVSAATSATVGAFLTNPEAPLSELLPQITANIFFAFASINATRALAGADGAALTSLSLDVISASAETTALNRQISYIKQHFNVDPESLSERGLFSGSEARAEYINSKEDAIDAALRNLAGQIKTSDGAQNPLASKIPFICQALAHIGAASDLGLTQGLANGLREYLLEDAETVSVARSKLSFYDSSHSSASFVRAPSAPLTLTGIAVGITTEVVDKALSTALGSPRSTH